MAGSILRLRAAVAAVGCRQFASSSSPAWLMLPSNKMYSPGEKKVVNIKSSNINLKEYQVVGSSRGWVGLFKEEYDIQSCSSISSVSAWNPMSGDHIKLPPIHTIPNDGFGDVSVEKLIVDDAECSRVVIVGSSQWLGVCCPGRCSEWTLFEQDRQNDDVVACSQRKFYTNHRSNCGRELVRWNISEPRRPRVEWKSSLSELDYVISRRDDDHLDRFPRKPDRDYCYSSPHLVYAEHSDQLFIVTRHYFSQVAPDGSSVSGLKYGDIYPYMTVGFDVHLVEEGKGKVRYMKHSLDGLVMFVGLNDSFAVPAADFPHLKPDSIYFTDHHEDAYYSQCPRVKVNKVHGGCAQYILARRLKRLKPEFRQLNHTEFGSILAKAELAREAYAAAEDRAGRSPECEVARMEMVESRQLARQLSNAETSFLRQKAKARFVIQGDRCTKYFHAVVKTNRARNNISSLLREDGSIIEGVHNIGDEFVGYYSNLFGVARPMQNFDEAVIRNGPRVTAEEADLMVAPVLDDEIKRALFNIKDDKAPGPDGYTSAFFKQSWSITGPLLCDAVREFFTSGNLLKQLNHTIVALIPKVLHDQTVSDFRPIACCNVVYKIITKILTRRMEEVLPRIVANAQSAFVKGRAITDNIFLAQELVRLYNVTKKEAPRAALKIDLRKAYDTISWDFLRNCLHGLGFPVRMVQWIMECVSTASYSISVNGGMFGMIEGQSGVRQGDPMSPSLFILCMEYFSRLMAARTRSRRNFGYHRWCTRTKLTHLIFADDLFIFSRGDRRSVQTVAAVLDEFSEASGLCVNKAKSRMFTAGIKDDEIQPLYDIMEFEEGAWPTRYLGVPLSAKRLVTTSYSPLIDKVTNRVNGWFASTLSYAGRMEMVRSVLQGIVCYWFQIFPVPLTIISKLNSIFGKFLWNSGLRAVAWDDCCRPKEEGGLGLRDLKAWNSSLLAKSIGQVIDGHDSLWMQWLRNEKLGSRTIWEWDPGDQDSVLLKAFGRIKRQVLDKCDGDTVRASSMFVGWNRSDFRGESINPRYSFIAWLAMRKRLSTAARLWNLADDTVCPLCKGAPETVDHLFFHCPSTLQVWDAITSWLGMRRGVRSLYSVVKWCKRDRASTAVRRKAWHLGLVVSIYYIWQCRNKVAHGGTYTLVAVTRVVCTTIFQVLYDLFSVEKVRAVLGTGVP